MAIYADDAVILDTDYLVRATPVNTLTLEDVPGWAIHCILNICETCHEDVLTYPTRLARDEAFAALSALMQAEAVHEDDEDAL